MLERIVLAIIKTLLMKRFMKAWLLLAGIVFVFGCGDSYRYEQFTPADTAKGREDFDKDSAICLAEKNKHSHKIQGREFGFKGSDVGYFGCMKLKGWDRKSS